MSASPDCIMAAVLLLSVVTPIMSIDKLRVRARVKVRVSLRKKGSSQRNNALSLTKSQGELRCEEGLRARFSGSFAFPQALAAPTFPKFRLEISFSLCRVL